MMHSARFRKCNRKNPKISAEMCIAISIGAISGTVAAMNPAAAPQEDSLMQVGADVTPGALLPEGEKLNAEDLSKITDMFDGHDESEPPFATALMRAQGVHKIFPHCDQKSILVESMSPLRMYPGRSFFEPGPWLVWNLPIDETNRNHLRIRLALALEVRLPDLYSMIGHFDGRLEDPDVCQAFRSIGIPESRILWISRLRVQHFNGTSYSDCYESEVLALCLDVAKALGMSSVTVSAGLKHPPDRDAMRLQHFCRRVVETLGPDSIKEVHGDPFLLSLSDFRKHEGNCNPYWTNLAVYHLADMMSDLVDGEAAVAPSTSEMLKTELLHCSVLSAGVIPQGGKQRFLQSISRIVTAIDWKKLQSYPKLHGALVALTSLVCLRCPTPEASESNLDDLRTFVKPLVDSHGLEKTERLHQRLKTDRESGKAKDNDDTYLEWAEVWASVFSKVASEVPEDCLHSEDVKARYDEFRHFDEDDDEEDENEGDEVEEDFE